MAHGGVATAMAIVICALFCVSPAAVNGDSTTALLQPRKTAAQIAPFPPMQWHSWGLFTHEDLVTEANMQEMAEALVSSGMAAAGYDTLNVVCNGWVGRDPKTGVLIENRTLWPSGIAGFARRLHAMTPPLKMGCYTAPCSRNCMCGPGPQGTCEEGTGFGYEQRDMEFFATSGCDHVMVDMPDTTPDTFRARYDTFGAAIANSSNPNMVFGVWCSSSHPERWAAQAGGHYWRLAGDSYDSWSSVLRQWDVAYSIPNIDRFSRKGSYAFLDEMLVGDVPGRKGSAWGAGLNHEETIAHMSMWVMAASPLLTSTDVRNMTAEIKEILTNPELLEIHKDPLAKMAIRVDVGHGWGSGNGNELHAAHICSESFPQCQEGPGDPGYPGQQCQVCYGNWSVFEKPLHDNSSAVMALNRGDVAINVSITLSDLGLALTDWPRRSWSARDVWAKSDLGVFTDAMNHRGELHGLTVLVPAHGVRLLRMEPVAPPPSPPPPPDCPSGYQSHAPGLWLNGLPRNSQPRDVENGTAAACARKCDATAGCLAFEVYQPAPKACYIFVDTLQLPFTPNLQCFACVRNHTRPPPAPAPPPSSNLLIDTTALGLSFEGIGGLNGGNGARLLANYPEQQRNEVLDLLFKPGVGCALDILKVELGADGFAANAGGEPAIRHIKGGPLAFNGTNFFLMREAVKRNPNITLYALSWSFPGWFAGRNALGIDQAEYSADWVDGVREFHDGKVIVGVWNEQDPKPATANYAKLLRKTLDGRGHTAATNVHLLWPDSVNHNGDWDAIAAMVNADPALDKTIHFLGSHYPAELRTCPVGALRPAPNDYRSTCAAKGQAALTKKPLVDSEAWGAGPKHEGNDIGGATMARMLNWEPIVGRISATIVWQILWGSYDGLSWANHSLIRAASPWSGIYEILPPGYAVAHHTRFSASGWRYCDDGQGNGWLPGGGSYVTRVSPNGRDFSIVIETMSPDKSCSCDTCGDNGGPPTRTWSVAETQQVTLHIKSPSCSGRILTRVASQPFATQPSWFNTLSPLQLSTDCVLQLTLAKDTQLTLSTLQLPAGMPTPSSTQETAFPLPWSADFNGPSGESSGMPSFFQDLNGAFQLSRAFDGGREPVMEQVARHVPIMWFYGCTGEAKLPLTIFGAQWVNVSVSTTVALVAPPIDDPYGFNSSYGTVKPQAAGASLTGQQCCTADGPPLDCTWANISATVAVRVGGGAPSWTKTGYGYFFTVSVTGVWQLMASGALSPPPYPRQPRPCPAKGWKTHVSGFWANADPIGGHRDTRNATVPLCAKKCITLDNCLAFGVFDETSGPNGPACYTFLDSLAAPFTAQPEGITCVKVKDDVEMIATEAGSETNVKVRILVSGHLASGFGLQTWHNISLAAAGCELKAEVDGVVVASATDVGCNATQAGYAAVGSGWHAAQFKEVWAHDSTPNY